MMKRILILVLVLFSIAASAQVSNLIGVRTVKGDTTLIPIKVIDKIVTSRSRSVVKSYDPSYNLIITNTFGDILAESCGHFVRLNQVRGGPILVPKINISRVIVDGRRDQIDVFLGANNEQRIQTTQTISEVFSQFTACSNGGEGGSSSDRYVSSVVLSGDNLAINITDALLGTVVNTINTDLSVVDNQGLSLTGTVLNIQGGQSVDLGPLVTTDQTLSVVGNSLSISGGNTVVLPSVLPDQEGQNDKVLTTNGTVASWETNTDNIDDADNDPTNEFQTLSTSGVDENRVLVISNGGVPVAIPDTKLSDGDITALGYIKTFVEIDGDTLNEIELPPGGANGQVLQTDGSGNYSWTNGTAGHPDISNSGTVPVFASEPEGTIITVTGGETYISDGTQWIIDENTFIKDANGGIRLGDNYNNTSEEGDARGINAIEIIPDRIPGGSSEVASGDESIAIGVASRSTDEYAIALGYRSVAEESRSISIGAESRAFGVNGVALGERARSQSYAETSIGNGEIYTPSSTSVWMLEDKIFDIGLALPSGKSAFSIYKSGATKFHPVLDSTVAYIPNPQAGMLIFNENSDKFEGYDGTQWQSLIGSEETAATIKTKYESNANTNAFTDTEKTNIGNQSGTNTGDQDLSGLLESVVAGTDITIDNTDPQNPIINSTASGGGGSTSFELTNDTGNQSSWSSNFYSPYYFNTDDNWTSDNNRLSVVSISGSTMTLNRTDFNGESFAPVNGIKWIGYNSGSVVPKWRVDDFDISTGEFTITAVTGGGLPSVGNTIDLLNTYVNTENVLGNNDPSIIGIGDAFDGGTVTYINLSDVWYDQGYYYGIVLLKTNLAINNPMELFRTTDLKNWTWVKQIGDQASFQVHVPTLKNSLEYTMIPYSGDLNASAKFIMMGSCSFLDSHLSGVYFFLDENYDILEGAELSFPSNISNGTTDIFYNCNYYLFRDRLYVSGWNRTAGSNDESEMWIMQYPDDIDAFIADGTNPISTQLLYKKTTSSAAGLCTSHIDKITFWNYEGRLFAGGRVRPKAGSPGDLATEGYQQHVVFEQNYDFTFDLTAHPLIFVPLQWDQFDGQYTWNQGHVGGVINYFNVGSEPYVSCAMLNTSGTYQTFLSKLLTRAESDERRTFNPTGKGVKPKNFFIGTDGASYYKGESGTVTLIGAN